MTRIASSRGRDLIESVEGLRMKAYQDGNGVWTLAYGHTANVHPGDTCTQEQADAYLAGDLHQAEWAVNTFVKMPINQNQFDALCSFVYNIGSGNFSKSTMLKLLNEGKYEEAAQQFFVWVKVAGKFSQGLMNRRIKEETLFMEAV